MARSVFAVVVLGIGVLGIGPISGQTPPSAAGQGRERPGSQAESRRASGEISAFIRKAADAGMKEVDAGRTAQSQATNDQVKAFASRMVQDHSKSNQELMVLAETLGVDLKAARGSGHELGQLGKGEDFDRAYMAHMVKDHTAAVRLFEQQASRATDPDVKAFAERTLPVLREHLDMARSIQQALGTKGTRN